MLNKRLRRALATALIMAALMALQYVVMVVDFTVRSDQRHLPDIIIIGVKKGGTRALLRMSSLHPNVRRCSVELNFFSNDIDYELGVEFYRSLMPLVSEGQLTVEKSTQYFTSPAAPERLFRTNNRTKLIIGVRDPVERAISDYAQGMALLNGESNATFEESAFLDKNCTRVNTNWKPINVSTYINHMPQWLELFPLEQILIVDNADLVRDPLTQMKRLERFIGLEPFFSSHNFFYTPDKSFVCLKRFPTSDGRCLNPDKGRKHPEIRPEAVARLREYFAPFNQQFYKLVKRDFGWPQK